jgi:hypothetical protein
VEHLSPPVHLGRITRGKDLNDNGRHRQHIKLEMSGEIANALGFWKKMIPGMRLENPAC